MNIMLNKFKKFSMSEMAEGITRLDPRILNNENASTLIGFCPEPDDISAANEYDGELILLG